MSQLVHLQHNGDDVSKYLEQAATIVAELELDGDLKVPAFEKAVDLLAGTHLVVDGAPFGQGLLQDIRRG